MEQFRALTIRRRNLKLYEWLVKCTRVKLPDNWCGYQIGTAQQPIFKGHHRFDDEAAWVSQYEGPDFCREVREIQMVEERLLDRGMLGPYMLALVDRVYPAWRDVYDEEEVYLFWYTLVQAHPQDRARAAMIAIGDPDEPPVLWVGHFRKALVKRVARLTSGLNSADLNIHRTAVESVRSTVKEAHLSDGQLLVAVAWYGAGRFKSLRKSLWAASRSLENLDAVVEAIMAVPDAARCLWTVIEEWRRKGGPSDWSNRRHSGGDG